MRSFPGCETCTEVEHHSAPEGGETDARPGCGRDGDALAFRTHKLLIHQADEVKSGDCCH